MTENSFCKTKIKTLLFLISHYVHVAAKWRKDTFSFVSQLHFLSGWTQLTFLKTCDTFPKGLIRKKENNLIKLTALRQN